VLSLLPLPSWVKVTCSVLVLLALIGFLVATLRAIRAALRVRAEVAAERSEGLSGPRERLEPQPGIGTPGQLVAATSALVLAVALGVAVDPVAAGVSSAGVGSASAMSGASGIGAGASGVGGGGAAAGRRPGVPATGHTTTARVEAKGMRFIPDTIEVPAGDRLVVELTNTDPTQTHDLVFSSGTRGTRLDPGAHETIDVGVVAADTQGWCSVIGHRQMGMVLTVRVTGADAAPDGSAGATPGPTGSAHDMAGMGGTPGAGASTPGVRLGQAPPADFRAVPAELPPLTPDRVRKVTLTVEEVELEIAPGVKQKRWTYNGSVPGPVLHGRVGDTFEVTLVNHGTMGHSIDFHAGDIAPDEPMRTIPPAQSLVYTFTAKRSGIWMYHCSTMPMSAHIAAGMFGAVVIEPDGLAPVAHSYVLVQSEAYVDGDGTTAREVDAAAVSAERPSAVTFNGIANQYDTRPLTARVGERVRFWVLDAGPNRASSFHVVGGQFDTVYLEGRYLLREGRAAGEGSAGAPGGAGTPGTAGSQALGLLAAQGGFVEMVPTQAGHYPFVSHLMVDAERGAHGILQVGN
jgi:nitrite reductase (NO-forming)